MFELQNIAQIVAVRDALVENRYRVEGLEDDGEAPDLYDSTVLLDLIHDLNLEISRQGY